MTAKRKTFSVSDDELDSNRIHVVINGLGVVTINRTDEGVILDVHNQRDNESIASLALEENDFLDETEGDAIYHEQIAGLIHQFDPDAAVTSEFSEKAGQDGLHHIQVVESWFADCNFDINALTPLEGGRDRFGVEVRKLEKPYLQISKSSFSKLMGGCSDYFIDTRTGKVVTFGGYKGGSALMPLNKEEASMILKLNAKEG